MTGSVSREARWAAIVRMTEALVAQVQAEEWDLAAETEEQRLSALQAYCAPPLPPEEAAVVAENLRSLAEIQSRLIGAGRSASEAVAARLREFDAGRRAANAYRVGGNSR